MADLITNLEAQAWGERTKLLPALTTIDSTLLGQIQSEVLGRLAAAVETSTWVSSATTPQLAKTIIAKFYVAAIIDRQYSEDEGLSPYARMLRQTAQVLLDDTVSGEIDIPGATSTGDGLPSSWPDDTTLGPDGCPGPYFRMDSVY